MVLLCSLASLKKRGPLSIDSFPESIALATWGGPQAFRISCSHCADQWIGSVGKISTDFTIGFSHIGSWETSKFSLKIISIDSCDSRYSVDCCCLNIWYTLRPSKSCNLLCEISSAAAHHLGSWKFIPPMSRFISSCIQVVFRTEPENWSRIPNQHVSAAGHHETHCPNWHHLRDGGWLLSNKNTIQWGASNQTRNTKQKTAAMPLLWYQQKLQSKNNL